MGEIVRIHYCYMQTNTKGETIQCPVEKKEKDIK